MNYLIKNKKIKVGILVIIIIISICYYIYSENTNFLSIQEQNLEIDKQELESTSTEDNNPYETKEENVIIVHVSGAVNKPGIVELSENSRIADAIEKAGGLKETACIDEINLAYVLDDGVKLHIPTVEEQKQKNKEGEKSENSNLYVTNFSGANVNNEKDASKKQTSKININTATQEELETLPGIGPTTAIKIINYRSENGKFKSIEDIKEVSGIGESKFNNIKNMINV